MDSVSKLSRSPLVTSLAVSLIVFLAITGLRSAGWLEFLELATYDWYIRLQPKTPLANSRIILIAITDDDIRNLGRWPMTDSTMARMLAILTQCQPRGIGLDVFRDIPVPPGHGKLEWILSNNHRIITVMKFGDDVSDGIGPPPVLANTDQVGFNDILVDPGGIVRRGLLFLDDGETTVYAFSLLLSLLYLQKDGIIPLPDQSNPLHIRLGETTIRPLRPNIGGYCDADTSGYQFLIDYKDDLRAFPTFSLSSLLSGNINLESIEDKLVIIGVTAKGVKDFFYTPNSRGLGADQQIPGIALHAEIANQLISHGLEGRAPVRSPGEREETIWIFLWSVMGGIMGLRGRSSLRFSLFAALGLFILFLASYFALLTGWWIPAVPPAVVWLISSTAVIAYMSNQEKRQRVLLMDLFSRHVSKDVAETIWQQRDLFIKGGRPVPQRFTVTVMFTDLQGFTPISEKMAPDALVDWLNTYMESMAEIVLAHGGIIDDYIGDGLKVDFGVPLARCDEPGISRDAVNAVSCALAMKREMQRLNAHWREHHLPTSALRIGIYTGPVLAGALGSPKRLKYTTLGDTVNIASRLESYGKDSIEFDAEHNPCRILIGETTWRYIGNQFKIEEVGQVLLKGKKQRIAAYLVIDRIRVKSQHVNPEERE